MNMPGFTAESSLGPTLGIYWRNAVNFRTSGGFVARPGAVKAQQLFGFGTIFGGDCFGSPEQCFETFCSSLPFGPPKAKCSAACQQPSVCGDCRCTFNPDGVQTCQRTCTRSTPSDILICKRPCFPLPPFPEEIGPV